MTELREAMVLTHECLLCNYYLGDARTGLRQVTISERMGSIGKLPPDAL